MQWPETVRVYAAAIPSVLVKEVPMDKPTMNPEEIAVAMATRRLPEILYKENK